MLLLENLISEIKRVARKAVFLQASPISSDQTRASVEVLENLCQKYQLDFQILTLA